MNKLGRSQKKQSMGRNKMKRQQLAPILMPLVYVIVCMVCVIGMICIAIRALAYSAWEFFFWNIGSLDE